MTCWDRTPRLRRHFDGGVHASGWASEPLQINRLLGELGFKFCWRPVAESRMEQPGIVNLVNELGRVFDNA